MKVMTECGKVYATDNCVNRDYCAQWSSVEKIINAVSCTFLLHCMSKKP